MDFTNRNSNGSFVLEKLVSQSNSVYIAEPILVSSKGQTFSLPDSLAAENLIFQLNKLVYNKILIK